MKPTRMLARGLAIVEKTTLARGWGERSWDYHDLDLKPVAEAK